MTSKLTITREQATDKEIQMLIDSHENGTAMFLRVDAYYLMAKELQECRKAELDSKPVAWTDEEELRDANESGSGYLFGIGHDANKFADPRRQIMLYLHAQQPVVPDDVLDALQKVARIRLDLNGFDGDRRGIADCLCDAEEALIEVVNRRAAMLQAGNSPVIPDGWTGNDKANAALMMLDRIETVDPVDDDRIDGIKRIVRELAAAPHDTPALNSVQSVVTVPGKWIPASERIPENKPGCYEYLVFETLNNRVNHDYWNAPDKGDDAFTPFWNYYGEHVTHWMPLPAAPQEVKGE